MTRPVRVLLAWCPDWPVIAAEIVDGIPASAPVAVMHANRVIACSPAARREGVAAGLRRREAQSRCPQLIVVGHDPAREARAFEPVVAAVEQVAAGVSVLRPGSCAVAARGPARYFGSEEQAAERVIEQIAQECEVEARVGVADGLFAAGPAARAGRVIPVGRSAEFLSELDLTTLERPELADRLRRLGIHSLGAFAALPASDVLARFGLDAALAHRLAAGADHRPLAVRRPPPELTVTGEYDDPLDRLDVAAFAARELAQRLHRRLAGHGLACTRLGVEAVTADGQRLRRSWRHDGVLSTVAIADRVRWQLAGWLAAAGRGRTARPTAGIRRLRLEPEQLLAQAALQPGLWGEPGADRERADRAFARVQGLLGPEAVVTAVAWGGRSPVDRVRLLPWGELPTDPPDPTAPWPGRLPAPSPATVLADPLPAEVLDADGRPVRVDGRLALSAPPARVLITDDPEATGGPAPETADGPAAAAGRGRGAAAGRGRGAAVGRGLRAVTDGGPGAVAADACPEITGWAGPWPVDERWWAPGESRRLVRLQVLLADGRALLLGLSGGAWRVEAVYD